jgi:hypothetical protein
MGNSSETDAKAHALAPMNARISEESKTGPYRWGYFQAAILIPWSMVIFFSVLSDLLKPRHDSWHLTIIGMLMGLLGLPVAYGPLRKKAFALMLVFAMFGFALL